MLHILWWKSFASYMCSSPNCLCETYIKCRWRELDWWNFHLVKLYRCFNQVTMMCIVNVFTQSRDADYQNINQACCFLLALMLHGVVELRKSPYSHYALKYIHITTSGVWSSARIIQCRWRVFKSWNRGTLSSKIM